MAIRIPVIIPTTPRPMKDTPEVGKQGPWGIEGRKLRDSSPSGAWGKLAAELHALTGRESEIFIENPETRAANIVVHGVQAITDGVKNAIISAGLQIRSATKAPTSN